MRLAIAGLAWTAIFVAAPAQPQNWLENGEFEAGTTAPWEAGGDAGLFQWDELDHAAGEGSVLFSSTDPDPTSNRSAHQCTQAHEGDTYDTRAWFFIPGGQGATGYAQLFVNWFSDEQCGTSPLGGSGAPLVSTIAVWTERQINGFVAPAGTIRARVFLQLTKNSAGSEFRVHADGARLIPHPFFADGFGAGNAGAWSDVVP